MNIHSHLQSTMLHGLILATALSAQMLPRVGAKASTFGSGTNAFEIEFVSIGDPGNPSDTVVPTATSAPLPSGSVDYIYRMAKYEISEEIIARTNLLSDAAGAALDLNVDVARGPQKPATGLSWFDAARFVNFLNEDHGATPAYKFDAAGQFQLWELGDDGFNPENPYRNTHARYFLPSADEWHKAAYYDPSSDRYWLYPYGSDEPPIPVDSGTDPGTAVYNQTGPADVQLAGGVNPFGLVGMAGNVSDWEETSADLMNEDPLANRGANGSSWVFDLTTSLSSAFRNTAFVHANQPLVGIRVVSIPEPSTLLITAAAILAIMLTGRRQRRT